MKKLMKAVVILILAFILAGCAGSDKGCLRIKAAV